MEVSLRDVRHLGRAECKHDASVSLHPPRRGGFLDRPGDPGPSGIEQLMIRLLVGLRNSSLDFRARRGRTSVDFPQQPTAYKAAPFQSPPISPNLATHTPHF